MADLLIPSVTLVQTLVDRKTYEVVHHGLAQTLNVTVTDSPDVFAEWVGRFHPEHRSFFPVGVAVHVQGGPNAAQVLTLCIGADCLVFQLFCGRNALSRDVTVFLRDVCTCYGWRTDAYDDLLRARHTFLSLGRLTDIQSLVPGGHGMGLGDFGTMVLGGRVPEPTVSTWTDRRTFKKNQIRETAMEARICYMIGELNADTAPPNDSFTRVRSATYPHFGITEVTAAKRVYQVSISDDQVLDVTYTNRLAVLTTWLRSLTRGGRHVGLIGIDVNVDRGLRKVMTLAFQNSCLVYKVEDDGGALVPCEVFGTFLGSQCPFVSWDNRADVEGLGLGLVPDRVFDLKDEFPATHSYADVSRLFLGYEMPRLSIRVNRDPSNNDIMNVAVQAYVCLTAGKNLGYEDRVWM